MIEWYEESGLDETASVVRQATAVFGETFPRSQFERNKFLDQIPVDSKGYRDPFKELDREFYQSTTDDIYDSAADKWLKEKGGITDLHDKIPLQR